VCSAYDDPQPTPCPMESPRVLTQHPVRPILHRAIVPSRSRRPKQTDPRIAVRVLGGVNFQSALQSSSLLTRGMASKP
jgi:hypothetical protein